EGGGVRPLSRRSFLMESEANGGDGGSSGSGEATAIVDPPCSPPREDSPLLGKPQQRRRGKKASLSAAAAAATTSSSSSSSFRQRPFAMAFAGDEGGGVGKGEEGSKPGGGVGSDYSSEAGSRRTTVSGAPTTLSAADEALLGTFMEVLAEG
ncbi:unnamed protein product, partial [Hapterophycus canaliculatus]